MEAFCVEERGKYDVYNNSDNYINIACKCITSVVVLGVEIDVYVYVWQTFEW